MSCGFSWVKNCFWILGGILLQSGLAKGEAVQIHVRSEAQIAESNVELGAIGNIKSTNVDDEKVIAKLILGESPKAGKSVEWSAEEISKRLRPYKRILQGAQLKLPDHIVIHRRVNFVSQDELRAKIEEMLKSTLPDSSWEAQLIDAKLPDELDISRDGSVQVVPLLQRPRGATNIEVQIVRNGNVDSRSWVTGLVKYSSLVAVLRRRVEPRSTISQSDIAWLKKDISFFNDIPATAGDLDSAVARVALVPGMILSRTHLERQMAVHFGDEVTVTAGDGSVLVSSRGVVQQNGYIGDRIKVKSVGYQRILNGVVAANGVVRVGL